MSDTSILKGELEKLVEQAGIVMEDNHSMKGLLELRSSELVAKDAEIKALREAGWKALFLLQDIQRDEKADGRTLTGRFEITVSNLRAALGKEATK